MNYRDKHNLATEACKREQLAEGRSWTFEECEEFKDSYIEGLHMREQSARDLKVRMAQLTMNIAATKTTVKLEIESLIEQCYREIRNLEQYDDERMLVATADLQFHMDRVLEASQDLEYARDAAAWEEDDSCAKCGKHIVGAAAVEDIDGDGKTWLYCSEECCEAH